MKYWDIIPPEKPKKRMTPKEFKKLLDDLNPEDYKQITPYNVKKPIVPCLHKNCIGCKNGWCSGVHMISCPCPACSPSMITLVDTKFIPMRPNPNIYYGESIGLDRNIILC